MNNLLHLLALLAAETTHLAFLIDILLLDPSSYSPTIHTRVTRPSLLARNLKFISASNQSLKPVLYPGLSDLHHLLVPDQIPEVVIWREIGSGRSAEENGWSHACEDLSRLLRVGVYVSFLCLLGFPS